MKKSIIRYVPIGDSYTIGEGLPKEKAWPNVLEKHLQQKGLSIELIANPSQTGWTTLDAIERELPVYKSASPTFSTLLIGVNDWVQEVSNQEFHARLVTLIDKMQQTLPNKNLLLFITIPDFSATPNGGKYAHGRNITQGISEFNDIIKHEAKKRKLPIVDIFPLTQKMKNNPKLYAQDGLHPSANEYVLWEKLIFPVTWEVLKES